MGRWLLVRKRGDMSPLRRITGFLIAGAALLLLNAAFCHGMKEDDALDLPANVCEVRAELSSNATVSQPLPDTPLPSLVQGAIINEAAGAAPPSPEQLYGNYQQMVNFNSEAASRNLRILDTVPDGNCFYRAVSQALGPIDAPDQSRHIELRSRAVAEMMNNPASYVHFFGGPVDTHQETQQEAGVTYEDVVSTRQETGITQQQQRAFDAFVSFQARDREWVDEPAIAALSRSLGRMIEVYQPHPQRPNDVLVRRYGGGIADLEISEPVRVAYNRFNHYGSMHTVDFALSAGDPAYFQNDFGMESLENMMEALTRRFGNTGVVTGDEDLRAEYEDEEVHRVSEIMELMVGYSLPTERIESELGDRYNLEALLRVGLADLLARPENEINESARMLEQVLLEEEKMWRKGKIETPQTVTELQAKTKGQTAFKPLRAQVSVACRKLLLLLEQHTRDTGMEAARSFTRITTPQPSAPASQPLPVVSPTMIGINSDSVWRAVHNALHTQYDNISADDASAVLQHLRAASVAGEIRTSSGTVLDVARHVALEHFGPVDGGFPAVSASIGYQSYAAGIAQRIIGAYLTHFPINDQHFAAEMSSRLASSASKASPTYSHFFEDTNYQFDTPTLCCSYYFMEPMIRSAQLLDTLITDLYPVVGHPRGGGVSHDPRRMEVAAAVLNSILREGSRIFRVASTQATIMSLSMLESLQQEGGRHFDLRIGVGGGTVRLHVLTEVSLPASIHPVTHAQLPASEHPFTVILIGTDHVSLARFPHLVRGILLADQVFAGLCNKSLTPEDMQHSSRLFKGTGLTEADYRESFNMFVEENALQQAFILALIAHHGFKLEQAVRTVMARRRLGYGIRCRNLKVAQAVADELMARRDRPEGVRLRVYGTDIVAVSVGKKRRAGEIIRQAYPTEHTKGEEMEEEGEDLQTLRREDASWATVAFTSKEKDGMELGRKEWLKKRKLNSGESAGVEGEDQGGDQENDSKDGDKTGEQKDAE